MWKLYKVEIIAVLVIFILSLFVLPVEAIPIGKPTELYYDDGVYEEGWGWVAGGMWAVHFVYEPPIPIKILKGQVIEARVYISSRPKDFKLHILDETRVSIFCKTITVTPTTTGWCVIDLSRDRIKVVGHFYVALEYLYDYMPYIGLDITEPNGESLGRSPTTGWGSLVEFLGYDGDLGIRVTVALAI